MDLALGVAAAIPYAVIGHGFGLGAILVYPALLLLAVRARSISSAAIRLAAFGVALVALGLSWTLVDLRYALVATLLVYAGFGAPALLAFTLRERPRLALLASTGLFSAILLVLYVERWVPAFLSVSWAAPGYGESVALTSHVLVSAWMYACAAAIALFKRRSLVLLAAALLLAPIACSLVAPPHHPLARPVEIAVVQPNLNESWSWRKDHALDEGLKQLIDPTAEAIRRGAKIVVWPEDSVPVDVTQGSDFDSVLSNFSRRANATIVVGTLQLTGSGGYYPEARIYGPNGGAPQVIEAYRPIGINANPRGVGRLETATIRVDGMNLTVASLICYEEFTNAAWIRPAHPDLLLVLSDYSDLGDTRRITTRTTFVQSRRFGVPIVKAVNTGPSMILGSNGTLLDRGRVGSAQLLVASVQ